MKKTACLWMLAALLPLLAGSCRTPDEKGPAAADRTLERLTEKYGNVGIAAAVVRDGRIVYSGATGVKNLGTGEKLGSDDLFRIASISKSFTATALMQLADSGKVSLDDDVSRLIGFPVRNPRFPDDPITLRMILSHTSGMSDRGGYFSLRPIDPAVTEDRSVSFNDYRPGTGYEYCNLGYNLAGAILERLTGERFDVCIRNRILRPLGLDAGHNVDSLDRSRFAVLYSYDPENCEFEASEAYVSVSPYLSEYRIGYSAPLFSPTGGVKISAEDLARYMTVHLNGGTDGKTRLISADASAAMQTPVWDFGNGGGYGLALQTYPQILPGKTLVGHTGDAYGLYSGMMFCPEENWGIVIITNGCKPFFETGKIDFIYEAVRSLYGNLI